MKKKLLVSLLLCLFAALAALAFTACEKGEQQEEERGVRIETPTLTLEEEQTYQLVLVGADAASAEWRSDDLSVATVGSGGLVTAVAEGSTMIRATVGGEVAVCSLTVTPYRPQAALSLIADKSALTLYEADTYALTVTLRLGSEAVTPVSVTYASSAESVAAVGEDGTVTAVGQGTAQITVTAVYEGQSVQTAVAVTVAEAQTVLAADFAQREVLAGEPLTLSMTVRKGKTVVEDHGEITFTLSDDEVGSVSGGVFTGAKKGNTVITAKCTVKGEDLSLDIPMRVREEYTVTFLSEGQQVAEVTVLDGETAALPADPAPPADRSFSRWLCGGKEFTGTTEVQQDMQVEATWKLPTAYPFANAEHVNVYEYSSIGAFATDITQYNDTWPQGQAALQPQGGSTGRPSKADWYVTLPAVDFSLYEGVYFTLAYNHAAKVSVMGQQVIAATSGGQNYQFGVIKEGDGWSLTLDGKAVMTLKQDVAEGKEGLRFDFVLNPETDNYAQLTFSPMYYYVADYRAEAEAALAAIPEAGALTALNCMQYKDELEEYLAAAELFTDYEKTAHPTPEKVTRLQEILNQPDVPMPLNAYTATSTWVNDPEKGDLVWGKDADGKDVAHMAWVNGDMYAFAVEGNTIIRNIGAQTTDVIENGVRIDTDVPNAEHRIFFPKIDFTEFTKVTVAIRTNSLLYIGLTNNTADRVAFSQNGVGLSGTIAFAYEGGALTASLTVGEQVKTLTVTDKAVIEGSARFTVTVWAAAQFSQAQFGQFIGQRA